jgi:hypothetical protein
MGAGTRPFDKRRILLTNHREFYVLCFKIQYLPTTKYSTNTNVIAAYVDYDWYIMGPIIVSVEWSVDDPGSSTLEEGTSHAHVAKGRTNTHHHSHKHATTSVSSPKQNLQAFGFCFACPAVYRCVVGRHALERGGERGFVRLINEGYRSRTAWPYCYAVPLAPRPWKNPPGVRT